jgi:hypothetical protein
MGPDILKRFGAYWEPVVLIINPFIQGTVLLKSLPGSAVSVFPVPSLRIPGKRFCKSVPALSKLRLVGMG